MPRILSPEEYAERYEGFRVDAAPRGPLAAGLSSGIDQAQGIGYGILGLGLDAVGLNKAADWTQDRRRLNAAEGYYAGRPDLDQIENLNAGNAADMLTYQLAKQGPTIGILAGANLIPGVGQVASRLGLASLGARVPTALGGGGLRAGADLAARQAAAKAGQEFGSSVVLGGALGAGTLYNQSVDAGDPSPFSALAAAPVYGALEAAVPSALRGALRAPANLPGGLARRMATAGALGAAGEAGTELAQNEMEMAFGPALTPEEAYSQRLNAAAMGALVGGPLGSLAGIRRPRLNVPETVDQDQFDLTQRQTPQYNLTTQMDPLQGRIDQNLGLQRTARKDYEKQFLEAFNAPSGFRVADPATGLERELSVGEYQQMQLGDLRAPSEQGVANTQQSGNTPTSAAPTPAPAPAAPSILTESDQFYANTVQMPLPSGKSRQAALTQLYDNAVASGVPVDSPALDPYWNQISTGNYYGKNQQAKLRVLLQNAIVEHRKGTANVSTPSAPAVAAPASGAGRSAAPVGGVGNTGSVPDVRVGDGGDAGNPQPAGGQAAPVADAGLQRPTPVGENTSILAGANQDVMSRVRAMPGFTGGDPNAAFIGGMRAANPQPVETPAPAAPQASGEPVVQRKRRKVTVQPGTQANAYVTPEAPNPKANAPVAEDGYVDDEDAWNDFRPDNGPEFSSLAPGLQQAWGEARKRGLMSFEAATQIAEENATEDGANNDSITETIRQIFGDRDAEVITDAFVNNLPAREIGEKYKLSRSRVAQLVGDGKVGQEHRAKKIKQAQEKFGWTDDYVASLMGNLGGVQTATDSDGTSKTDTQIEDADGDSLDEKTSFADAGLSTISSEGGSTGFTDNAKDGTIAKLPPRAQAMAYAQRAVEHREAADELMERIRNARDTGADSLVENQSKQSLDEAVATYKALRRKYRAELAAAQAALQKIKGLTSKQLAKETSEDETEKQLAAEDAEERLQLAREQYDALGGRFGAPEWDELSNKQREQIADLANRDKLDLAAINRIVGDQKFGKTADNVKPVKAKNPYTTKELLDDIKNFVRADIPGRKLLVVDSVEDLLRSPDKRLRAVGAALAIEGAYGVATDGRAFLIANRIEKGSGRAKFMHEVGAHLGLEKLLPKALYDKLTKQITEWAKKDDGSVESKLALNAVERVQNAGTKQKDRRGELLAYFIEEAMEAGIDPTADVKNSGPLRDWFRTLWAAFKIAVRKLGFKPESLNAQDVVNLAFGAARLEIAGTWHGTAASFRNFRNKYIGSGEGATAYGWGTYLAQRTGIAKGYWAADIDRKSGASGNVEYQVGDKRYAYSDGASEQDQINYFAASWLANPPALVPGGSAAENFAAMAERVTDSFEKKAIELARTWHAEGKKATRAGPEGNLMRVDTAVDDELMFDYDKPLSKQSPAVMDVLYDVLEPVADEIVDRTNRDIPELTGRDLIGTSENDLGLLSSLIMDDAVSLDPGQDKQFDEAVRRGKFHEAASHFMRVLGIQGIKFYDAKSRGTATQAISYDGRSYNRDDLRDQVRKYRDTNPDKAMVFNLLRDILRDGLDQTRAALEAKVAQLEQTYFAISMQSAARYNVEVDKDQELADAKAKVQRDLYEARQLAWLNANENNFSLTELPKTRNLVIFDDRDIFRVGSEAAADRQRMRFGKNAAQSSVPKAVQPQVESLTKVLKVAKDAALNTIVFSEDLFKRAASMGINAAMDMDRIYRERAALTGNIEREVTRIENLFNRIPKAFQGTGPRSANQFLYDSTREGKWGFQPAWRGATGKVKVDPEMEARFKAMPKEARAWVEAVFEHGDKMLALKKKTLVESTNSEYDALIAAAKADGNTQKAESLEKDKAASLRQFQRLFSANEAAPYAPMRRFGNWVVSAKSKEYLDAEAAKDTKRLGELQKDPDHYHVSFAESYASALELQRQLQTEGHFAAVPEPKEKEKSRLDMYGGLMDAFNKLRGNIESELGGATDPKEIAALKAARETVVEMYLQALAENSARKSEMRRRGVSGEIDMLRSFSTQGRADAHFLAAAKFNPQAQQAVVKMRQQKNSPGNETEKSMAFNEVMARHEQSMKYEDGGWFDVANKASRVTSVWLLATNPMYYLQNLTQPFVLSLPFMTGKHDYTAAAGQLMRSYFQLGALLKSAKVGEGFDFSKVSTDKNEQDMVLKLVDRGRIDIGMDTELGKVKLQGDNAASRAVNRGDQFLRSLSQKVEAINRVSTALAAYRLERKAGAPHEAALEYADQVIAQTHGDYTRINAPRAFNTPIGKVALQFRKFQLIQLTLLSKLVYNSFKGASAGERAAARKMLTYTLGHTGVLAGVVGMPGFAAAAFVINKLADAFGDDDEPYNLENELRKMLGGGELAQIVMRGAPNLVGTDLSGKLGMGNALSILPYTEFDASREGFNAIATGLTLGATGGLGARVFDALGNIKDGDYYRGLMGVAPTGVSGAIRAYVEATRGETNKRGDVLVGADEISNWESFAKAIGWPTTAQSERRFDRQVAYDNRTAFENKASKIKNEYARAVREKDANGRRQAIEKWQRLQNSRREAGFKPQPLSTLMKAPQEQAKRERNTAGGVQFNRQNRQFVMEQTQ